MTAPSTQTPIARRPIRGGGPGRFVTHFVFEDHCGRRLVWHSRRNRKGLDPELESRVGLTLPGKALVVELRRVTWWIGLLFMIGSALFAIGSLGLQLNPRFGGAPVLFVGSLFFTSAAYLQFAEVINEPHPHTAAQPRWSFFRVEIDKIGWWATLIQLVGTLLFNVNTFEGMRTLAPDVELRLVWMPNAGGSICFLVASYLAYAEVSKRWASWQPRNVSWWIVVINFAGSVAFGVSAVAGFVEPSTGTVLDASLSNETTFAGALCFFIAAYMLIPEMTAHASRPVDGTESLDVTGGAEP